MWRPRAFAADDGSDSRSSRSTAHSAKRGSSVLSRSASRRLPRHQRLAAARARQPERCFSVLYEKKAAVQLRKGYRKSRLADRDVFPFCFLPRLQYAIFEQCIASRPVVGERDVLDCYFTSYFNAWLDNHNLYTGKKKVVTGFAPRLAEKSLVKFFAAYPDGTLITLVREPRAWYASMWSATHFRAKWPTVEAALRAWRQSAEAAIEATERFPERVLVLAYEQVVGDTRGTMERVAERIGIAMSPALLMPTFNGRPIRANSRVPVERYGIVAEPLTAYRDSLDAETIARIEDLAGDVYERAVAVSALAA